MMNILEKIQASYDGLPKRKKKIADFLLEHWTDAAFMSTRAIARELGVSESLVVQFCTSLGYSGFQEVKEQLKERTHTQMGRFARLQSIDHDETAQTRSVRLDMENIQELVIRNAPEELHAVADLLLYAERIYTAGVRNAGAMAALFSIHLNELRGNALFLGNMMDCEMDYLRNASERDTLVVFSFPSYSSRTIELAEYAAVHTDIHIIAVTDSLRSPLAKYAEHTLLVRQKAAAFYASQVGTLGLINILMSLLVEKLGEAAYGNLVEQDRLDAIKNK